MRYEVKYSNYIITDGDLNALTDGCSSIMFKNIGSDAATIDGNIPLAAGEVFEFNNLPNEEIHQTFLIAFATTVSPKVLVVRKFVKKII